MTCSRTGNKPRAEPKRKGAVRNLKGAKPNASGGAPRTGFCQARSTCSPKCVCLVMGQVQSLQACLCKVVAGHLLRTSTSCKSVQTSSIPPELVLAKMSWRSGLACESSGCVAAQASAVQGSESL